MLRARRPECENAMYPGRRCARDQCEADGSADGGDMRRVRQARQAARPCQCVPATECARQGTTTATARDTSRSQTKDAPEQVGTGRLPPGSCECPNGGSSCVRVFDNTRAMTALRSHDRPAQLRDVQRACPTTFECVSGTCACPAEGCSATTPVEPRMMSTLRWLRKALSRRRLLQIGEVRMPRKATRCAAAGASTRG